MKSLFNSVPVMEADEDAGEPVLTIKPVNAVSGQICFIPNQNSGLTAKASCDDDRDDRDDRLARLEKDMATLKNVFSWIFAEDRDAEKH